MNSPISSLYQPPTAQHYYQVFLARLKNHMPDFGIVDIVREHKFDGCMVFFVYLASGHRLEISVSGGELDATTLDQLEAAIFNKIADHLHLPWMDRRMRGIYRGK